MNIIINQNPKIMKKTMLFIFSFIFTIAFSNLVFAQQECDVMLESIKGEYIGGCKKGLAHGEGTSTGTDMYSGKFKKGLPHGEGKYTYASGEFYVGNFKEGKKSGMGKFKLADGTIAKEGIWEDDEFIKEQDLPDYKIGMRRNALNVAIRELGGDENKIDIVLVRDGRETTTNVHDLMVVANSGVQYKNDHSIMYKDMLFPFKANVKFKSVGKFTSSVAGDTKHGEQNSHNAVQMPETAVEFQILEEGNWEVRIKY
jgi:hypothetical protein